MTVLFVIMSIALLLSLDWYLVRQRERRRAQAGFANGETASAAAAADRGVWFHPGHAWVRVHDDELVSVGATGFASNFPGAVGSIELPAEGSVLQAGDPAWTIVSTRGRRLRQVMPIDGEVIAVNPAVRRTPRLAQNAPYGDGWLLRVRPRDLGRSLQRLLSGVDARRLMDDTIRKLTARLQPAVGAVAQDGGEWSPGFGDRLDDLQWEVLRAELFDTEHRQDGD